jgi:hypothetical protein
VSQVYRLLSRTYKEANARTGEEVSFRGQTFRAVLAPIAPSFDLTSGGFTQGGEFSCQILVESLATPPHHGESLIYRGRSYSVSKKVNEDKSNTAYLFTIAPGGKL